MTEVLRSPVVATTLYVVLGILVTGLSAWSFRHERDPSTVALAWIGSLLVFPFGWRLADTSLVGAFNAGTLATALLLLVTRGRPVRLSYAPDLDDEALMALTDSERVVRQRRKRTAVITTLIWFGLLLGTLAVLEFGLDSPVLD